MTTLQETATATPAPPPVPRPMQLNTPPVPRPRRRRLRVFAFDPMTSRLTGNTLTIDVPMEPLGPGPVGELVQVVDIHPTSGQWFRPVDLDDPALIHQDGLRPSGSDPRSHQQIVYAVASSVIERFERFLGRRFRWKNDARLVLVPHAFEGSNAFFDPERRAVLFGYFAANAANPGRNLPGQRIFTCLSLDIIAHEVTHALVHRLRRYYMQPTNPDVLAFHEAFADLVALFHHFVFPEVVHAYVADSRGDLVSARGLFDLAAEFGESTGRGRALRSAIEDARTGLPTSSSGSDDGENGSASSSTSNDAATDAAAPDQARAQQPTDYRTATEPHQRGTIFVTAVFDAYVRSYQRRIADLLRIATGGTGVLPEGNLHPDLVNRVAGEATKNANRFLGMVIRAFDYLPVVDVTFGDMVRAIVTSDRDLHPNDELQLRATLIEAFRQRAIYPDDATSLAEEGLTLFRPVGPLKCPLRAGEELTATEWFSAERTRMHLSDDAVEQLRMLVARNATQLDPIGDVPDAEADEPARDYDEGARAAEEDWGQRLANAILEWARSEAASIGLEPDRAAGKLALAGRHASFRQAEDRQPQPEIVLQIIQRRRDLEKNANLDSELFQMIAATTLVVTMTGEVRYVIPKPLLRTSTNDTPDPVIRAMQDRFTEMGATRTEYLTKQLRDVADSDIAAIWAGDDEGGSVFQRLHVAGDEEAM